MLKKNVIALLVLALAGATGVATAQDRPGPFVDEAFAGAAHFLQLDETQTDTFLALLEDRQAAADPIREEIAAVETAIRDQLESGTPDATTVGDLVIERYVLGSDLGDVHQLFVDGFEAMLNEDQAIQLEGLRDAKRVQRILPAFERFGLLAPGPQDAPAP
jgi:hypothetical protein